MFDYKCTTRTYRHSLQYNIRWIMEFEHEIIVLQIDKYKETGTVEPCS